MSPFFPYIHVPSYHYGPFALQVFGISIALAVIIGSTLARKRAEELKLDFDLFIDSFFWVIPGGFILSHIVSIVLYYPEKILKDPLILLYFWESISSFGGFLGGFLVAFIFFKVKKVPLLAYMEALAYGLIPGFMLGRMGCALAHDHPGMWLPNTIKTGMEIGTTYVKVGGKYTQKIVQMPGWESNATWIALGVFVVTVGLLTSLISEKRFFSRTPFLAMLLGAGVFYIAHPMMPAFIRTFGIPFPYKVSSDWAPQVFTTYFNLQDLEPGFEGRVFRELPGLFAPYYDLTTMGTFFTKVPYEITVPAKLVWGDFSHTAVLAQTGIQKTYHIQTRIAYDLGLIEFFYFVCFFTILSSLVKERHRRDGFILAMWFISYAPIRFLLDLLRTTDLRYANGLTPGNYMAIFTFALGVLIYLIRPQRKAGDYIAPCNRTEEKGNSDSHAL